eukprot:1157510-Pelagomonas_calceolata.AAC.14
MDEDLPGEGPGATATALTPPGSGTGAGTGRDSSMAETLGMPPTHAAAAKHPHPHPQRPEHTSSGMANNPASGSTEGLGMFPSPWHSHQGLPSEQPFQQPFQQQGQQQSQQQGQHQHQHQLGQPPGSGPMHPNFSTLPPELLSTLQHGNSAAQHYHHQQQQQQQPPEMEQLPMGFTYRPTAFQVCVDVGVGAPIRIWSWLWCASCSWLWSLCDGVGCGAHRAVGCCGHYVMGLVVVHLVQLAVVIIELPAKPEPRVRVVTGELNATLLGPYFEKSCESDSCRPPSRFEAELWQGMWPQPSAVSSPCLNDVPQAPQKAFRGERAHVNAGWACEEIIKHPLPVGSSMFVGL